MKMFQIPNFKFLIHMDYIYLSRWEPKNYAYAYI